SAGVAAGNGIPLIPFDDLLSCFENFHASVRIVCQRLVLALRHWSHRDAALGMSYLCSRFLDIQQPELHRIHSDGFRHLIHHLLPAELEFLLHIASGRTGLDRICSVLESDFFPVRDQVNITLGSSSATLLHRSGIRTIVHMQLTLARDDALVFSTPDL